MKVITFSTVFPAKHPRKGEPTFFPEKILKGLSIPDYWSWFDEANINCGTDHHDFIRKFKYIEFNIKSHTIRVGNRWKVGDWFSPRVWSGKPYASKQIIIAPDIEIKKIWTFESYGMTTLIDDKPINHLTYAELAKNDGLTSTEMHDWFFCHPKAVKEGFKGQILCWNDKIEY